MDITVEQLRSYLGTDEEHDRELEALCRSAIEMICRTTGINWTQRTKNFEFLEAVRVQVWLSFYGVRDAGKNTLFLQNYLAGLLTSLQLCRHEEEN